MDRRLGDGSPASLQLMAESTDDLYRRALQAADSERRLPIPPLADWETFPFEGDLRVKPLAAPTEVDRPRRGEEEADCWRCQRGTDATIWHDEHWTLAPLAEPSGLPVVVLLEPRAHHDVDDLPPHLVAELGPMIVRVERAVRSIGEVGRVHICRWGDGGAHFHLWFMARPARLPQTVGSFAAIWDDILPPLPADLWRSNLATVASAMGASTN